MRIKNLIISLMCVFAMTGCGNAFSDTHVVTFDTDGGSFVESQTVKHNEKIKKPADPTKPGSTFVNWTFEGEEWSFIGYVVTEDMTLTANWSLIDYTATFVDEDGKILYTIENVHYGDVVTYGGEEIPDKPYPKDHYVYSFSGWDKELVITGDMTFTAQYTKVKSAYFAKYLDYDGTILYKISTNNYDEALSYLSQTPKRGAYRGFQYSFKSWELVKGTSDAIVYQATYVKCSEGLIINNGIIEGYNGSSDEIEIPYIWDGCKITGFRDTDFISHKGINKVTFIVDSIEEWARIRYSHQCDIYIKNEDGTDIVSLEVPASFSYLTEWPFSRVCSITSITFSDSITYIPDEAFLGCTALTSVTIPDSITIIGNRAFYGCSSLPSIEIPTSVFALRSYAFGGCVSLETLYWNAIDCYCSDGSFSGLENLKNVFIGNEVSVLPSYFLYNCSMIQSITIPDSVTSIGRWAFYGCSSLTSVHIPDGVVSIGSDTFNLCSSLTNVSFASGTSFGDSVFSQCNRLSDVYVRIESISDYLAWKSSESKNFYQSVHLIDQNGDEITDIAIPEGTTSIPGRAFYNCSSIESISIPDSVVSVGELAFYGCASLESIVIPDSVTSIGGRILSECNSLESITTPFIGSSKDSTDVLGYFFQKHSSSISYKTSEGKTTRQGKPLQSGSGRNTTYTYDAYDIPGSIKTVKITGECALNEYTFQNCDLIENIVLSDLVTGLSFNTFNNCSIERISIIVSSINTFMEFNSSYYVRLNNPVHLIDGNEQEITEVFIPEGTASLPSGAFFNCSFLTSIIIPSSITSIGERAFCGCSSLTSVHIPDGVVSIGEYAFNHCDSLTNVSFASGTSFENYVFLNCDLLSDVFIRVGSIGNYLAWKSSESKVLSQRVHLIDQNGDEITDIAIPEGTTSIPYGAFYNCSSIESVSIPDGITFIGSNDFYGCTSLETVIVPISVKDIYMCAFDGCTSLENVFYEGNQSDWEIVRGISNIATSNTQVYFFSEEEPSEPGNYWHYSSGKPAIWGEETEN